MPIWGDTYPSEALTLGGDTEYYADCIKDGIDPLWVYRYINYRLNGRFKDELILFGSLSIAPCLQAIKDEIYHEWPKPEEDPEI